MQRMLSACLLGCPMPIQGSVFFFVCFVLFLCVCLFAISWAAPAAYGGSQARGLIGAVAASLRQSHATQDPSHICNLHHSSRQHGIHNTEQGQGLNPRLHGS